MHYKMHFLVKKPFRMRKKIPILFFKNRDFKVL